MMPTNEPEDGAWFRPKRFGYGAGLPIAWQGWAMLGIHIAVILLGTLLFKRQPAIMLVWVLGFALVPMPLYAAKTRGGWKWRGGGKT